MALTATAPIQGQRASARVHVQRFGTFLSNMVMPNIAAFVAWGLITAMFIKNGWLNWGGYGGLAADSWVAQIGGWGAFDGHGIVGPMITYLLPLLIGYTGGKMVYDVRGGVVGAIATMGIISSTSVPMFMGAMIMGPLGGWSMKKLDALWSDRIKPGFEMLVNNFSAGIWGLLLSTAAFFLMSPIVTTISNAAGSAVKFLVDFKLLPLTSLLIEPAKVLFLNNAINHGVLDQLGLAQAADPNIGKSILFLLEANPGPGLGLLLAFMVFGRGMARASASGAALIHFVGGIHEIYFPYVLAKPRLIVAMIAGGMTQVFTNVIFGSGLRAPAAPGSIIAVLLQTPTDSFLGVIASVVLGATATFLVAAVMLRTDKSEDEGDLTAATAEMEALKGKKSSVSSALLTTQPTRGQIHRIVFACDAGMGSSAMGASILRKKIKAAGFGDVTVVNKAISDLTDGFDLVVTHQDLMARAQQKTGSSVHVAVENFLSTPRYDEIVDLLGRTNTSSASVAEGLAAASAAGAASPLALGAIRLDGTATDRDAAITEAGNLLVASGAVTPDYIKAMHAREASISTYMGNLLAIPHGTLEALRQINRSALSFVRYPEPILWNGNPVKFVIGIASSGDEHLALLSRIASVFLDPDQVAELEAAQTPEQVRDLLARIEV